MFSPVGPQPPSVYWRRRILFLGMLVLLVVLIVLTVQATTSGGGGDKAAAASQTTPTSSGTGTGSPTKHSSSPKATTSSRSQSSSKATSSRPSSSSSRTSPPSSTPTSVTVPRCRASDLTVQAVVGKSAYRVGDEPMVELQVTNTGSRSCVQDLADPQVVLKVYNGESRVWGSHDCEVQSGTDDRTLAAKHPVRVSITWSGYTSQPKCAGTRQRVGAGTYTLYAALSGKTGKATQFSIG